MWTKTCVMPFSFSVIQSYTYHTCHTYIQRSNGLRQRKNIMNIHSIVLLIQRALWARCRFKFCLYPIQRSFKFRIAQMHVFSALTFIVLEREEVLLVYWCVVNSTAQHWELRSTGMRLYTNSFVCSYYLRFCILLYF